MNIAILSHPTHSLKNQTTHHQNRRGLVSKSAAEVKAALGQLSFKVANIPATAINTDRTQLQENEIPATVFNAQHTRNTPVKNLVAAPPPTTHWAKSLFRIFQRFLAVCFLLFGIPVSIYAVVESNNMSVPKSERDDAIAALIVFGVPFTGAGSWMLWSLNRRVRKEKFDSEWLRQHFYQTLNETKGEVTVLRFAQNTPLSGKDAQKYLDAKVKEFNGETRRSPEGETLYRFKL